MCTRQRCPLGYWDRVLGLMVRSLLRRSDSRQIGFCLNKCPVTSAFALHQLLVITAFDDPSLVEDKEYCRLVLWFEIRWVMRKIARSRPHSDKFAMTRCSVAASKMPLVRQVLIWGHRERRRAQSRVVGADRSTIYRRGHQGPYRVRLVDRLCSHPYRLFAPHGLSEHRQLGVQTYRMLSRTLIAKRTFSCNAIATFALRDAI